MATIADMGSVVAVTTVADMGSVVAVTTVADMGSVVAVVAVVTLKESRCQMATMVIVAIVGCLPTFKGKN